MNEQYKDTHPESVPLITCSGVSGSYKSSNGKKIYAVTDISLSIMKNEIFGLVGESGCGKSTLGYMLLNLKTPDSGHIFFEGRDLTDFTGKERKTLRRNMQVIFQNPSQSLNPLLKTGEQIRESLDIFYHGMKKKEKEKAVDAMLESVGLDTGFKNRYPVNLSGGQLQRIAIAQALILHPAFIVCDEPVSSLDVSIQAQVLNLLQNLQKKEKMSYLLISHNLNVVSYMADRIGVMYLGSLVELGTAPDIASHPLHPYTQALFCASGMMSNVPEDCRILKGDIPDPAAPPGGCPFHTRCYLCQPVCRKIKPPLLKTEDGRLCACHLVPCAKT